MAVVMVAVVEAFVAAAAAVAARVFQVAADLNWEVHCYFPSKDVVLDLP